LPGARSKPARLLTLERAGRAGCSEPSAFDDHVTLGACPQQFLELSRFALLAPFGETGSAGSLYDAKLRTRRVGCR